MIHEAQEPWEVTRFVHVSLKGAKYETLDSECDSYVPRSWVWYMTVTLQNPISMGDPSMLRNTRIELFLE